jgi:TM2 domain-containing membrane protein YozV
MPKKKPTVYGVPALVSAIWPGIGQIMKKEIGKGIMIMTAYFMAILLCFVLIGFFLLPIIWIYGIYDAYNTEV